MERSRENLKDTGDVEEGHLVVEGDKDLNGLGAIRTFFTNCTHLE